MVLTTTQLRAAWGPACKGVKTSLRKAYEYLDAIMASHDYEPRAGVTGSYNCRAITGGSAYSLHAYGPEELYTFWTGVRVSMAIAVDINWDTNPYGSTLITDMPKAMVNEIKALRTNNGKQVWGWGGDYRNNKDAMHYEIVCAPADLETGIRIPVRPKPPTHVEEDDMQRLVKGDQRDEVYLTNAIASQARHMRTDWEAGAFLWEIRSNGGTVITEKDGVSAVVWNQADVDAIPKVPVG